MRFLALGRNGIANYKTFIKLSKTFLHNYLMNLQQKHMIYVKSAEFGLKNLPSTFDKDSQYAFTVEPKKV